MMLPLNVPNERQLLAMAKQPEARFAPLLKVLVAVPVCAKFKSDTLPVNVEVPAFVTESKPCTRALPVVVAPPLMVRPVICVPAPTVDEP